MYNKASNKTLEVAREALCKLAQPAVPGESIKGLLLRVSRKLPTISYGRVRSIWYQDDRIKISADELTELTRAAKIRDGEENAADDVRALRRRLELLEQKIEALERENAAPGGVENG